MAEPLYPVTPQHVDPSVIAPSATFKQEVVRVLWAIIFFIVVYILLMAAALGLAALCAYGGISMIVAYPRFITLMLGVGMIGLGLLVVFFLLKFLFSSNKVDRSHLTEINEADQPELFGFIRTLTKETQTPFPKKIYVSSDVNASVFYDSGFWSMFFPIRKNLQIGLGLVNSVNISEFKAILAHEFGHFSQRSMKLGSYVYNVNKVIYNMLYDNREYGNALQSFANVSSYFAIFANLTAWIISGIQSILQQVYGVVNKSYMSLSRQMEFHADSVAAYVSGGDHLVTSLRRLELANSSYQSLFSYYDRWSRYNQKPDNIYPQHSEVMHRLAEEHKIPLIHGLPQVTSKTFAQFNKSRLVIKDQWASHPSTDDREHHLNALNIRTEPLHVSAWAIFTNAEALQSQITNQLYQQVSFTGKPEVMDIGMFRKRYSDEIDKYKLNERYKGFFNNRVISKMSYSKFDLAHDPNATLDSILTEHTLGLSATIEALMADIHIMRLISKRSVSIKTFEFDGKKCTDADATSLLRQLEDEVMKAERELEHADKKIVALFLFAAERYGKSEQLRSKYNELAEITQSGMNDLHRYHEMMNDIQPIYHQELEADHVHQIMHKVKYNEEMVKDHLKKMIADPVYHPLFSEVEVNKVQEYLSKNHVYFRSGTFDNTALGLMREATAIYGNVINERIFNLKKEILEEQLLYLN